MTKVPVEITRWHVGRVLASLRDAFVSVVVTGGVASLNHRLIAWNPPGSERRSCATSAANDPLRHHAEGIAAISRWSRSGATTPPVWSRHIARIPEGCQQGRVSVQKTILILHTRLLQKLRQLLTKRFHPMVFRLIENVSLHLRSGGWADGECSITILPRKGMNADLLMHPHRGCLLQLTHEIREAMRRLQTNKQMHMVRNTTDTLSEASEAVHGAAEVIVKAPAPIIGDERRSLFGGKHQVVMQGKEGRWHIGGVLASLRDAFVSVIVTGGVASLNHWLMAWNPPGSRMHSQAVCAAIDIPPRHTGGMIAAQSQTYYRSSCLPPIHAEGIKATSRWLRSEATTPPVCVRQTVRIPEGCQRHRSRIWGTIRAANHIHRCPFVILPLHRTP